MNPIPAKDSWCLSGTSRPAADERESLSEATPPFAPSFLSAIEVAKALGVSVSWVRRHQHELPVVRVGRLIRFDSGLLLRQFRGKQSSGNRLKTGGEMSLQLRRYQRGYVFARGKSKVWYGMFREDIRTAAGMKKRLRLIRLGTRSELPTKITARNKLAGIMGSSSATERTEMSFSELADRWKAAEGPTLKVSTFDHYKNALRAYILPEFGAREIANINREDVQTFLGEKARAYSTSTLRSMRTVLGLTLGWAHA